MKLLTATVLIVAVAIILFRAIKGPTIYDRILAVNSAGTCAVILVCQFGFFSEPGFFLDTALVYALINFIATIAILKFIEHRSLA